MAGELITQMGINDLICEKTMGYDGGINTALGVGMKIRGLSFPRTSTKASIASYTGCFYIPASITLGATINFVIHVTDDGTNAADLGTTVYFGVTTKPIPSTAVTLDMDATADAHLGAEQTGSGTLGATTGGVLAITVSVGTGTATMGSGYASGIMWGCRVRRMGEVAVDTCQGRVIVPLVHVRNA